MRRPQATASSQLRPPSWLSRILPVVIAALAGAPLVAGCQGAGTGSGNMAGTTRLTVAAIRGIDNAPLYIAARSGVFARAGLDVTIRSYGSASQELRALNDGSVDIAAGDYVGFFYAQATSPHPDLRIVADGYHAVPGVMEVLTNPDSGITTPQKLAGKTIGTPQPEGIPVQKGKPYSLETLAAWSVLTNDGVSPGHVTWEPLPAGELIHALLSHKVDAILAQEPLILGADIRLGAFKVLDSCSGATANLPLSGYFAVDAFARKHVHALLEFRSALQEAQASAVQPGPVRAVLALDPGMSHQAASLVTLGTYPASLNAGSLQRVADLMFRFEMLKRTLNVGAMVIH
jgi:NitT/TauT family transport system substrate-binding protein